MGKVTARTGPSHFKQLINMKKYTLIRAYDLCIVPTVPWLNTIWMRKANFESYIIPSENEWKDRRYGETGLLSWAWERILNFWPVLFVWNIFIIKLTKQPYTLFPQSHPWIHVFTCLFSPIPRYWQQREDWKQASQTQLKQKSLRWMQDIKVIQRTTIKQTNAHEMLSL